MKYLIARLAALALSSSTAIAAPPANPIANAERAFDAFTAKHGYTHGFQAWTAPGALAIGPGGARPIHDILTEAIAKDPSEADAPSVLRWWPGYVGISAAGDMGFDYGGWTNGAAADCSGPKTKLPKSCGLYFTIWQKQADGTWKWVMDTGAGPDFADNLPSKTHLIDHAPDEPAAAPSAPADAAAEVTAIEAALNDDLATKTADTAYLSLIGGGAIIADGKSVPARQVIDYETALAERPDGLVWKTDGQTIAASGDMAWTTGHTQDASGAVKGYYVRVWQRYAPSDFVKSLAGDLGPYWALSADIFHAAAQS